MKASNQPPRLGPVKPDVKVRVNSIITPVLPPWIPPTGRLPASVIPQRVARNVAVAGENALIPEAFGPCILTKPRFFAIAKKNNTVVLGMLWCRGEISSIDGFYLGNEIFTGTVTHYLGTAGQTYSTALANAIPGYNDALTGLCYSVVTLTEEELRASLNFSIHVYNRKLYDPRTATTLATRNFALMYRYVATQAGLTVDDASIIAAANFCEETVGPTYKRWTGGIVFDNSDPVENTLALLAEYANCFHVREAGVVKLIPDKATATTTTFSDVQADINAGAGMIVAGSLSLKKKSLNQIPNQVSVSYLDPSKVPWRVSYAETAIPAGDLRLTTFRMEGYRDYNTAYRYAVERQNRFNLIDLSVSFETFDEGLKVEIGDVVEVTHSVGLVDKKIRVLDVQVGSDVGRWKISGEEYDEAVYSNTVSFEPTYPDITLPSPTDVPDVLSVSLAVQAPQFQSGIYFSSIVATWPELTGYPYSRTFEATFKQAGTVVGTVMTANLTAVYGPLKEGLEYVVEVQAIGVYGARAALATPSMPLTITGKDQPPTDVPTFTAFGVGGEVRLRWNSAADNTSIWRYEIRYGSPSVSWAAATFLTRTDSLSYTTTEIAAGTWDILIKAIDNAFNESVNASRAANVEVDQSSDVFLLDSIAAARASSTLMYELLDGSWIVDSGETWNTLYPNAMSTYTSGLYSYQTPGAASYTSAELDPALGMISGAWQAAPTVQIITGSPTQQLELYYNATWNAGGANSVVIDAEKSRWKINGTGSVFAVMPPTTLRLDVFSRAENGEERTVGRGRATSAHAGTQLTDTVDATFQTDGVAAGDVIMNRTTGATAVVQSITSETVLVHTALTGGSRQTWVVGDNYAIGVKITTLNAYSALKSITFTPNGASNPVSFEPDNITLGNPTSFLVFGFDTFNEEVSEPFLWKLEGV